MEKLWKLADVETLLSLHRTTLKRWIYAGKINAVKVGNTWRIPESQVQTMRRGNDEGLDTKP